MGLITSIMGQIFGDGRNALTETAEVFRVNAENENKRAHEMSEATLMQFAAEFAHPRKGLFDRLVDGLNRLPRPMLALGTIGLFVAAMMEPIWFSERMMGISLIPEPLWWLMGAIVSFYFGARHQAKGMEFQRSVAQTIALAEAMKTSEPPEATEQNIVVPEDVSAPEPTVPTASVSAVRFADNAALEDWRAGRD